MENLIWAWNNDAKLFAQNVTTHYILSFYYIFLNYITGFITLPQHVMHQLAALDLIIIYLSKSCEDQMPYLNRSVLQTNSRISHQMKMQQFKNLHTFVWTSSIPS